MKIEIKKLTITNFKGIKSLEILFRYITDIFGENGAGKTTIWDSFLWLFFGKDSTDRKDFEMKPLDKAGNIIPKIDVEVEALIEVDGKEITIKRIQREKWVKKRGELTSEFTGNETLYYWNDVPLQQKQFDEKINELINSSIFKLITNVFYFNSLKWPERRSILLSIAGAITNDELVAQNPDFQELIKMLGDKTLEEFKRELSAKKKKIKDDLEAIPTRIDEVNKSMPEASDFAEIRKQIEDKIAEVIKIDNTLLDASKAMQASNDAIRDKQNNIHELKTKVQNIKNDVRSKFAEEHQARKNSIAAMQSEVSGVNSSLNIKKIEIENLHKDIDRINNDKAIVAADWEKENIKELVFNENEFICPSCQRPLAEDKIASSKQTLTENFNKNKSERLQFLLEKGTGLKNQVDELNKKLATCESQYTSLQQKLLDLQPKLADLTNEHTRLTNNSEGEYNTKLEENTDYKSTIAEIEKIEQELQQPAAQQDNSELKQRKSTINIELDTFKKQLNDEELITKAKDRITKLQDDEQKLAHQLADFEGKEYLAEQFTKAKMDTLAQRINGRFKFVTFKLFDQQINGGEIECCEALISGVPFSDANNASRINAGLDIINTLCEHYGVYAPIFIDNRESVNDLIDCNSQVVNLIVSKDKKLRVA